MAVKSSWTTSFEWRFCRNSENKTISRTTHYKPMSTVKLFTVQMCCKDSEVEPHRQQIVNPARKNPRTDALLRVTHDR